MGANGVHQLRCHWLDSPDRQGSQTKSRSGVGALVAAQVFCRGCRRRSTVGAGPKKISVEDHAQIRTIGRLRSDLGYRPGRCNSRVALQVSCGTRSISRRVVIQKNRVATAWSMIQRRQTPPREEVFMGYGAFAVARAHSRNSVDAPSLQPIKKSG
jgi:hypothetical protein